MTARWCPLLAWLLCSATAVAGAQEREPWTLLLPEAASESTAYVASPLRRLIATAPSDSLSTPTPDRRSRSLLSVEAGPGLSLLCDSSFGIGAALADLESHCLLGRLDGHSWSLGQVAQLSVAQSLTLDSSTLPLQLDFGLSWLRADAAAPEQPASEFDLLDPRYAPTAGMAGDLSGESLQIGATHWLSERSWVRVTGRGSRFRLERLLPDGPLAWNSQSLRIDAGMGNFAGSVTGRRSVIPQLRRSWMDLDLGVSWRTPWSAKLTVGARNLLTPADALSPELSKDAERLIEARTPYVRYQQDL
jgi:hypothetical protein